MREIEVKKRENWEKNKWLKIRDWVGEIIIYKGDGEIHFCQKNKRKKDTYVFSKNPKDTSVPPKETSVFKMILLFVNF